MRLRYKLGNKNFIVVHPSLQSKALWAKHIQYNLKIWVLPSGNLGYGMYSNYIYAGLGQLNFLPVGQLPVAFLQPLVARPRRRVCQFVHEVRAHELRAFLVVGQNVEPLYPPAAVALHHLAQACPAR